MASEEYNWLDDAFDESKPDPAAKPTDAVGGDGYDWIDDAFDDSKEDPLAKKGMTGCSSFAALIGAVIAFAILVFLGFVVMNVVTAFGAAASL